MRLNLSKKIIITIEAGVLIVIVLFSVTTFLFLQNNIKNQINSQLESISSLKINYIKEYLNFRFLEIEGAVKSEHIKTGLVDLLEGRSMDNGAMILKMLPDGMVDSSGLIDLYVINNDGVVIASSNKTEEGKIKSEELYFLQGKEKTVIQSFYYDLSSKQIINIIATPIRDNNGVSIGVLTEEIDTSDINNLMSDRAGLGTTGETFLINSFHFVTTNLLKEKDAALKKTLYSPQVNTCLDKTSNFYEMADYNGDKVFGYARYFPELESCLISKIDQSELMASIFQIIPWLILFILILSLLILISGYFIGESILKPLRVLRSNAIKIKEGNLDVVIEAKTNDEVGDMAISFKEMLAKLKEVYNNLEDKVKERTKKLEESEEILKKTLDTSEKANRLMIDRELKMVELKEEINKLKKKE